MASDVLQLGRRERGRRVPVERGVPVRAGGGALFKEREPPEVLHGPEPGPPSMEAPIHTSGHAEAPVALVRVRVGVRVGVRIMTGGCPAPAGMVEPWGKSVSSTSSRSAV